MFTKILAVTALSLTLGGVAFAEMDSGSIESQLPKHWKMRGVDTMFFKDPTAGMLRSDEEISTAYVSMTAEQRAMVKTDCKTGMGDGDRYGAAGQSATRESNESGTATVNMARSLTKLCTMIMAM